MRQIDSMTPEQIEVLKLKGMLPERSRMPLDRVESFSQWLDSQNDALAAPDAFEVWLKERDDTISDDVR